MLFCNLERPLLTLTYSIELCRWRLDRAHSCFPRVSRLTRRLATKTATVLLAPPPLPASTRRHPRRCRARPRCRARSTRTRTKRKKRKGKKSQKCQEKWRKQRTAVKVRQVIQGGGFQSGSSERPEMYQRSTLRE